MFHFTSFTVETSSYAAREMYTLDASGITPNISNFNIPSVYNGGNLSEECVISLIKIVADPTNQ